MFIYECFPGDSNQFHTHWHLHPPLCWSSRWLIALLKGTLTVGGQHYSFSFHTLFSEHFIICCLPTFPPAILLFSSDPLLKKQRSGLDRTRKKRSHGTYCVLGKSDSAGVPASGCSSAITIHSHCCCEFTSALWGLMFKTFTHKAVCLLALIIGKTRFSLNRVTLNPASFYYCKLHSAYQLNCLLIVHVFTGLCMF